MQPHIDQRADEIVQEYNQATIQRLNDAIEVQRQALHKARQERAALTDLLAELASVQDSHGWQNAHPHLRQNVRRALQGHFSSDENLVAALALLWRVRVDWEGGFTLAVDTLADIRAFLKNVEGEG